MARIDIPGLLRMRPDTSHEETDLHQKVLKALMARYNMSKRAMSSRHPGWKRADEDFKGYTPESVEDKRRKQAREKGQLEYTTITVPLTYAMLQTAHTYWTSVFLSRDPIYQLRGRHGEAEQGVLAMEALLEYQVTVGKQLVPLFIWLLDPGRYGFGVLRNFWKNETKRVSRLFEVSDRDENGLVIPGRTFIDRKVEEVSGYRGNSLYNVRPYNWYPDPRVPLAEFQQGEFCADTTYRNFNSLKRDGGYFNLDALSDFRKGNAGTVRIENVGSEQQQLPTIEATLDNDSVGDKGSAHLLDMTVDLIPSEWGLATDDQSEKWAFTVADEKVIIAAEPFGHYHDEFPYDLLMYEVEGYALDIRGMLEIGRDFNTAQSWLVNSHMFNVRRALNDQLVVDPSRVVLKDLTQGGPGKIIRAKPSAYGTPMRDAVHQLPITDITRSHLTDLNIIGEIASQILGINDNVMGTLDRGGRKTATEIRTASTFSISRLKTVAEYYSASGFAPLIQQMVANTKQFYFEQGQPGEVALRVAGDNSQDLQKISVTPEAIAGEFDYSPVDGTLPVDRLAQAGLFKELLLGIISQPQLATAYNIDGMLNTIARLSGIRNLKQFKIEVLPDAEMAQQVKAGNQVPLNGGATGVTL